MIEANKAKIGRRQFLAAVGISVPAAAVRLSSEAHADVNASANKSVSNQQYRESDHVKKFYRLARYPMK